MLFNPEAGKTSEEIIEIALRRITPELRAQVMALSEHSGLSIPEIVAECLELYADKMRDPAGRAAYHAEMDRREAPYGPDPLLKKEA